MTPPKLRANELVMDTYNIEPYTPAPRTSCKFSRTVASLEVGQSFLVPDAEASRNNVASRVVGLAKRFGRKFGTHVEAGGTRVFRKE